MIKKPIEHICQFDYESVTMNKRSIAQVGCLLSCIVMMTNAHSTNDDLTPVSLDLWLDKHKGYVGGSDVLEWDIALKWCREHGYPVRTMTKVEWSGNAPINVPVILEVDPEKRLSGYDSKQHFVILIDPFSGSIVDPAVRKNGGLTTLEIQRYKPVSLRVLS